MFVQVEQKSFYVLVTLRGRVDSFNLEFVKIKLRTLIKSGKKFIALDLQNVEFLGLAASLEFENTANELQNHKGHLYIIGNNQRTSLLQRTFQKHVTYISNETEVRQISHD
ncbi:MAG TPA: STAS domain-containing protein [Pseudobdellovibrionaceae bacterium]|nr:STAS domain-containing protein [Pseudobdellovibrionaceae bacterium]